MTPNTSALHTPVSRSPLLRLPRELRARIYSYILPQNQKLRKISPLAAQKLRAHSKKRGLDHRCYEPTVDMRCLRLNRQIYAEALQELFRVNILTLAKIDP
jgi:hypothetical protein